jgi:DNA-directed RNA polymerase subunit F
MKLSTRERRVALVAGLAAAVFLLDHWILTPVLELREEQMLEQQALVEDLDRARDMLVQSRNASHHLKQMRLIGLGSDASHIESQLLNALQGWSKEARLRLASLRPDRTTAVQGLNELGFQATAEGTMRALTEFMLKIETAPMPLRVRELQIASRSEGKDDLTIQIRISTIWDPAAPPAEAAVLPPAVSPLPAAPRGSPMMPGQPGGATPSGAGPIAGGNP